MIVTTAGRTNDQMIEKAKQIALELQTSYIPRRKRSITTIHQFVAQPVLVVGKERLELHFPTGREPLFFHPHSCLLYPSPRPRDAHASRMPSSA